MYFKSFKLISSGDPWKGNISRAALRAVSIMLVWSWWRPGSYLRQPYILGQPSTILRYCALNRSRLQTMAHPAIADPLHNPADHSLPFHCILLFIAWYVAGSLDFVTAACHKSFHPQANVSVCASHNYLLQMSKAFIKTDMAATSYTSPGTLLVLWISSFSCFPSSKPMFPRSYNQDLLEAEQGNDN